MEYNYPTHQPEVRELKNLKFKHQKKCGYCRETFTTDNGNQQYCNKCQKKLKVPEWDAKKGKTISRQTSLIKEPKKEVREVLMRIDHQ